MIVETHPSAIDFLAHCASTLLHAPVTNQMPLGIAQRLAQDPAAYGSEEPVLLTVAAPDGTCAGALVQTPPWVPTLSVMEPWAALALARALASTPSVEGALGPQESAWVFAAGIAAIRGLTLRVEERLGLYEITSVNAVPEASGARRGASPEDAALLQRWSEAFDREANPGRPPPTPGHGVRAAQSGRYDVWVDQGEPVAYAARGRDVGGWISIGPVYTPPERRCRGYATALVAEMSRQVLADGRPGCTLFTDLHNPSSNRIYVRIGYCRVGTHVRLAIV